MLAQIFTRYATTFTASLFLVSAVSGAALFVHAAPGLFHEMHVWLSMVLLVPVAFHIWRNWTGFMAYVRRRTLFVPLALSLVVAAVMAAPDVIGGGPGGGGPGGRAMALVSNQPLTTVASLAAVTPDELTKRFTAAGITVTGPTQTLRDLSASSGRDLFEILAIVPAPK